MRSRFRHLSSYVWILTLLLMLSVLSCQDTKNIPHKSFKVTATEINLKWDAPPKSDIAGYKIYYKIGSTTPPYDGTGLVEGNSPIITPLSKFEDPLNPEITIHGLRKDKSYLFVVTAYDKDGKESGFSEGIVVKPITGN